MEASEYKKAFSEFASGVTVISFRNGGKLGGLTASSFTSLSMDPPLLLFCLQKTSQALANIQSSGFFSVNILSSEQEEISNSMASATLDKDVYLKSKLEESAPEHAVWINGASASFLTSLDQVIEGGDHWILTGKILEAKVRENTKPLIYFKRKYHTI